jgi:hypothetical protein
MPGSNVPVITICKSAKPHLHFSKETSILREADLMCTLPKDSTLFLQHHLVNVGERIQQSIQKISCYTREVARKEQNIYPRYNDQRTQHLERPEGTLSIPHGAVLQCQGRGHHWRKGRSGAGETATDIGEVAQNSPGMFLLYCRSSDAGVPTGGLSGSHTDISPRVTWQTN